MLITGARFQTIDLIDIKYVSVCFEMFGYFKKKWKKNWKEIGLFVVAWIKNGWFWAP